MNGVGGEVLGEGARGRGSLAPSPNSYLQQPQIKPKIFGYVAAGRDGGDFHEVNNSGIRGYAKPPQSGVTENLYCRAFSCGTIPEI